MDRIIISPSFTMYLTVTKLSKPGAQVWLPPPATEGDTRHADRCQRIPALLMVRSRQLQELKTRFRPTARAFGSALLSRGLPLPVRA